MPAAQEKTDETPPRTIPTNQEHEPFVAKLAKNIA
jgi:hypothetical protein